MTAVTYKPLSQLVRWDTNPKLHDLIAIKASLRRWGFVLPLVEDSVSGKLVAGHGRLQALEEMRQAGEDAPARVRVEGAEWLVPVLSGVGFSSEQEAEAYLVADNRLVELGGWETKQLTEMLRDLQSQQVAVIGWGKVDMDAMLASTNAPAPRVELSEAPEVDAGIGIKQVVLYFNSEQFEQVIGDLAKVMEQAGVDNHTAAVLHLLEKHEANRRDVH